MKEYVVETIALSKSYRLLMVLLLALPGGLVGLILLFAASCPLWVAGVACMVLNLFVFVGVLALCRNLLEVVEYTA